MAENTVRKSSEASIDSTKNESESKQSDEVLKCKVCNKVYKKKGSFEKHLKLHSESEKDQKNEEVKVLGSRKAKRKCTNYEEKDEDEDEIPVKKSRKRLVTRTRTRNAKKTKVKGKVKRRRKEIDSDSDSSSCVETKEDSDSETSEYEEEPEDSERSDKKLGLQCKICELRFARPENLNVHMQLHNGEKPFSCHLCTKRFLRRDHLKTHLKRHSNPDKYACDKCGETFKREDHLKYHKINNHEGTIFLNELKVFNKSGKTKSQLEKTVLCEICGKGFIDQQRLKVHRKIHTESKRYQCEFCHKSFSNSSNFNVHIRLHTGKNPYKCCVCGECFRTSSKLKTHTRKHSGEYPFVCEVCGKLCGEKHLLKMHLLTHSGQKTHECSHCGKSFAHSSTLRSHIRLHTGSKPYVCTVCGHSFAQVSSLNYHKRTHTGEKPFTCHLCGNSYTRKTTLNTHLLRHSGTKLVSCALCDYTCYTSKQRKKHMISAHNVSSGGPKSAVKNSTQKNNNLEQNDQQMAKENDYITLNSALQSSTLTTSLVDQMGFNGPISSSNVTVAGFIPENDISMKSSLNAPVYYNISQNFLNSSDIPQSNTQFSNHLNMGNHHSMVNSGFNPSSHEEVNLQVPEIRNLSSSSYQDDTALNFYSTNTTDAVAVNPNTLSINSNGVIFSQKNHSLSQQPYFEPVCSDHNVVTGVPQTHTQFRSTSSATGIMVQEKNFEPVVQKPLENDRNNIWLTIGASPAHLSQNYNKDRHSLESIQSDNRGFRAPLMKSSNKPVENTNVVSESEDLIQKAMVSAEINHHDSHLRKNINTVDDSINNESNLSTSLIPTPDLESNIANNSNSANLSDLPEEKSEPAVVREPEESENEDIIENEKSNSDDEKVLSKNMTNESGEDDNASINNKSTRHSRNLRVRLRKTRASTKTKTKPTARSAPVRSDYKVKKKSNSNKQVTKVSLKSKKTVRKGRKLKEETSSDSDLDQTNTETDEPVTQNKRTPKKRKLYSCSECDIDFSKADHLSKHMSVHKRPKSLICLYCLQTFEEKESLAEHMQREHQDQKPFSCNVCDFSCIDVMDLKNHVKLLHYDIEYKCDICSETFTKSKYLKDHMTKDHEGSHAFSCRACNKSYAECSLLVLHNKQKHSGIKAYKCNLCSKVFVAAAKLQNHLRTHTGDKPFTCEYCGKVFAHLSLLSIHVKAHSSEKPFSCDFCAQCFTHKSTLTAHIRTHTGVKPFKCDLCAKSFAQLSSLNYHRKSHDGLKPFTCELCGKSFTRATTLKTHLMQHAGKKRFSCELCDFQCNRKHALRKHHHKKHSLPGPEDKLINTSHPTEPVIFNSPQIIKETLPPPSSTIAFAPFLQIPVEASPPPLPQAPDQNKLEQQQLGQLEQQATLTSLDESKEVFSQQMPGFFFQTHQQDQQLLPVHNSSPAMTVLGQPNAPMHSFQITFQTLHQYHQPS